jgi:signal transduction histidine kinase
MQLDPARSPRRVLIVDGDLDFAARLSVVLLRAGYGTECAATSDQMFAKIGEYHPQIVICDLQFLGDALQRGAVQSDEAPNPLCVALTAKPDLDQALRVFREGAADFLGKDRAQIEIGAVLDRCFKRLDAQQPGPAGIEVLRRAKEAAETASRAKTEFLATVSHELRTPLNAIIGFSELMIREVLGPVGNPQYCEYLEDIHRSGSHLLGIINDILDFSKAEACKLELHESEVDVHEVVIALTRLMGPRARDAGLALHDRIPSNLPHLWCDERKLKQMLLNLLTNAVKFTPAGGSIEVEANCNEVGFTIFVRDTGIGIAKSDITRVLQPFVQADNELSRRHEGTGLGLTLVNSMIAMHGGRLHLESDVGSGTTAVLSFPAQRIGSVSSPEHRDAARG